MSLHKKYVYLVEDDDALRHSLKATLSFAGYMVYSYAGPESFIKEFKPLAPAVLVTDMRMPHQSGVELQEEMLSRGLKLPMIFISGESSDEQIIRAFKNGAVDFLLKPFGREIFLSTIAKAIERDAIAMQELIRINQLSEALKTLSPRERQVFDLLAKGYGNKELVETLGIAMYTVKEYKSSVMYKLRLRSLAELIALNTSLSGK